MLRAPQALTSHHEIESFDSRVISLDNWLKQRAVHKQLTGALRAFVACDGGEVIAYYALASGAVAATTASGRFRRNMPDPLPVVILVRLAISRLHQGKGLGRALFQDAAKRVIHAADSIGIRGMLVHAISDEAKSFYLKLGLETSPLEPMTLMTTIADLRAAQIS